MLNPLKLEKLPELPKVFFSPSQNYFEIEGNILPPSNEKLNNFLKTIEKWITEYILSPDTQTNFHFKLGHFEGNSLLKLLKILESVPSSVISWHMYEDDEDMQETVEHLSKKVSLEFQIKYL